MGRTDTSGELAGKVTIVTGAARGVGRETALRMAAAGARVVLADLPGTTLEEATASAREVGEATHHVVDISDESAVAALVAFTVSEFGQLDVVVNNAALQGLPDDLDVMSQSVDTWDRLFSVNARGTMLMCKNSLGPMIETGGGAIVNIGSGGFGRR